MGAHPSRTHMGEHICAHVYAILNSVQADSCSTPNTSHNIWEIRTCLGVEGQG